MTGPALDREAMARLSKAYSFAGWSEPERGASVFVSGLFLSGWELPGWRLAKAHRTQADGPAAVLALWGQSEGAEGAMVRVDLLETASRKAARQELLRVLGEFQAPILERSGGVGEVQFGDREGRVVLFLRGNVVALVRNAGRKLVRVSAQAGALDALLQDQPDRPGERAASSPRFSAKPDGPAWRIEPTPSSGGLMPPAWFKFFTRTGEVQAAKDAFQYVPYERGRHAITVIEVDRAGKSYREDLAFSDAATPAGR
jgi:hypothetical protein